MFHEAISEDQFDLGQCRTDLHEITLKTDEPIFVKQFKIPDAHMEEVEKHFVKWLKVGVIEPAHSKYNSLIFVVATKNGGSNSYKISELLTRKPTSTIIA